MQQVGEREADDEQAAQSRPRREDQRPLERRRRPVAIGQPGDGATEPRRRNVNHAEREKGERAYHLTKLSAPGGRTETHLSHLAGIHPDGTMLIADLDGTLQT